MMAKTCTTLRCLMEVITFLTENDMSGFVPPTVLYLLWLKKKTDSLP